MPRVLRASPAVRRTFLKGDLQINEAQRATFRYSRQDSTNYCQGCGGTVSSFGTDNSVPGFTYFGSHTATLSNRIVNEFAALYAESNQTTDPRRATRPRVTRRTVGSARLRVPELQLGGAPGYVVRQQRTIQFRNALSISTGSHLWKVGGGVQVLPT